MITKMYKNTNIKGVACNLLHYSKKTKSKPNHNLEINKQQYTRNMISRVFFNCFKVSKKQNILRYNRSKKTNYLALCWCVAVGDLHVHNDATIERENSLAGLVKLLALEDHNVKNNHGTPTTLQSHHCWHLTSCTYHPPIPALTLVDL